jgi:hypothetical protein
MSLEDLGNIGEFVAAVGVIISLIYLAVQIRQNTISLRHASTEVTDLFWRGTFDPESLSEDEWHRFIHIASAMIRRLELVFHNHQQGFVPAQVWEAQTNNLRRWFSAPGIQRWFSELGDGLDAEFRRYVEQMKP